MPEVRRFQQVRQTSRSARCKKKKTYLTLPPCVYMSYIYVCIVRVYTYIRRHTAPPQHTCADDTCAQGPHSALFSFSFSRTYSLGILFYTMGPGPGLVAHVLWRYCMRLASSDVGGVRRVRLALLYVGSCVGVLWMMFWMRLASSGVGGVHRVPSKG